MLRRADLHELVCGTADACFVSGPDGLIRDWNTAAAVLFGVSAAEAVSRPCASIVQGNDADGPLRLYHRLLCSPARARQ